MPDRDLLYEIPSVKSVEVIPGMLEISTQTISSIPANNYTLCN